MESRKTKWLDEDGVPITSVVLESVTTPQPKGPALGDNQRKALEILRQIFQEQQDNMAAGGIEGTPRVSIRDWNKAMREQARFPASRCTEVKTTLLDRGLIEVDGGGYVRPV